MTDRSALILKASPPELDFDAEKREFWGYASTFGNVDLQNDRIHKGAYAETIAQRFPANEIKVLWQHMQNEPIGRPLDLFEDDHGLFTKAKITECTRGNDAVNLMRDKVIDRLSVGIAAKGVVDENEVVNGWPVSNIHKVTRLYEYSPVTFPANEEATIDGVKSLLHGRYTDAEFAEELRSIGPFGMAVKLYDALKGFGLVAAPAAPKTGLVDFADHELDKFDAELEELNSSHERAFLYVKDGTPILQIANRNLDGYLVVPKAVIQAADELGDLDIPETDKEVLRTHLDLYFEKISSNLEAQDHAPIAPWATKDEVVSLTEEAAILHFATYAAKQTCQLAEIVGANVE